MKLSKTETLISHINNIEAFLDSILTKINASSLSPRKHENTFLNPEQCEKIYSGRQASHKAIFSEYQCREEMEFATF